MSTNSFFKKSENTIYLEMEDSFDFSCVNCGSCCHNNSGHTLTSYDIYRLAKKFKVSMSDIIHQYCRWDDKQFDPIIPVTLMNMQHTGYCSLYENGKCTAHSGKPIFCAILPLNMGFGYENESILYSLMSESQMPAGCSFVSKRYTLRDWLSEYNILENDPDIFSWYKTIVKLMDTPLIEMYRNGIDCSDVGDRVKKRVTNLLRKVLYIEYDTERPFSNQIASNLDTALVEIETMYSELRV